MNLYRPTVFSTRERNCLPTLMRTRRRETCPTRTVLMRWRTTASWWMEMYVSCLTSSPVPPWLYLCFLKSSRWNVNCVCISWWLMFNLSDGCSPALLCLCSLWPFPKLWPVLFASVSSVWLFVLIPCSSLFLLLFNCCLLLSQWKVLYKKTHPDHLRISSTRHASHPICTSVKA